MRERISEDNQQTSSQTGKLNGYKWLLWIFGSMAAVGCLTALLLFIFRSQQFGWIISQTPSDYIDFGIFIGSIFTPLVATASLLLFWKTLRVQMKELSISSESLASTATTTKRLLEQESRLFELKQLSNVIAENGSIIASIGVERFCVNNEKYHPMHEYGGVEVSFEKLVTELDKSNLLDVLTVDRQKLNEHLDTLIMVSSYLLKYAKYGGDLTHYRQNCRQILDLTRPFFQSEDLFVSLFKKHNLADKALTLSKLNEALTDYTIKTEVALSEILNKK